MIETRGKRADGHGAAIDRMIDLLNKEYPVEKQPVQLWFGNDVETIITVKGTTEYGIYQNHYHPTIIVATKNRTPNQIAGVIAQQYARHLQMAQGKPDDLETAAEFAKEMNKRITIGLDLQHFHPEKEK